MPQPPVISLVSQKGGAGKSSLTYALGWELKRRHGQTLLLDMDARQLSLLKNVAIAKEKGFDPPAVMEMSPKELYGSDALSLIAKDYSAVLIDTPGWSGEPQRAAMIASDVVFVPVVFDGMNTLAIEDTLATLEEARKIKKSLRAAIIITQQMPRGELASMARRVLSKTGLPILRTEIFSRIAWRYANTAHVALGVEDPWSRAAEEMRALTDDVEKFIKGTRGKNGKVKA